MAKRYRQGCLTISLGHDSATISPTEGLKVEGHASGPAVKEFFDCSDYEYGLSVDTEQINILLLALLHEFLAGVHAFSKIKDFCKRYGVMFIEEKASVKSSEHGFRTISLGDDS
ncbi:MAG: hypothetical protein L7F78_26755, partial [Syntrophales bacterium LBB04]|nr:hypothetical protein [Syntrophales bacterium LBB04]